MGFPSTTCQSPDSKAEVYEKIMHLPAEVMSWSWHVPLAELCERYFGRILFIHSCRPLSVLSLSPGVREADW